MSTLVCFALKEEAGAFRKLAGDRSDVTILVTGIGRNNADTAVRDYLVGNTPSHVFTCGFAGGLNPALQIGDVVFATDDAGWRSRFEAVGAKPAKIHCADRIAVTVEEKRALRESTGADAVEMESEVVHTICRERGIPCATLRAISDTANDDLPLDFNKLSKADLSLDFGKLAFALLKQPGKIPALLRLQKHSSFAAQRLAVVLEQLV